MNYAHILIAHYVPQEQQTLSVSMVNVGILGCQDPYSTLLSFYASIRICANKVTPHPRRASSSSPYSHCEQNPTSNSICPLTTGLKFQYTEKCWMWKSPDSHRVSSNSNGKRIRRPESRPSQPSSCAESLSDAGTNGQRGGVRRWHGSSSRMSATPGACLP